MTCNYYGTFVINMILHFFKYALRLVQTRSACHAGVLFYTAITHCNLDAELAAESSLAICSVTLCTQIKLDLGGPPAWRQIGRNVFRQEHAFREDSVLGIGHGFPRIAPGGFNFSECNSIGNYQEVYPSTWAATAPTDLFEATVPFDNLEFVDGEGFWSVRVANGWTSASQVHYNVLIKVNGLCPVDQSPESISNVLCGPGTMFDFVTHQCLPINTCQSDFDDDGIVATSDLLLFLSDFGLSCP